MVVNVDSQSLRVLGALRDLRGEPKNRNFKTGGEG